MLRIRTRVYMVQKGAKLFVQYWFSTKYLEKGREKRAVIRVDHVFIIEETQKPKLA